MKTTVKVRLYRVSWPGYMYFADISIVNSGMHEAYAHVYPGLSEAGQLGGLSLPTFIILINYNFMHCINHQELIYM